MRWQRSGSYNGGESCAFRVFSLRSLSVRWKFVAIGQVRIVRSTHSPEIVGDVRAEKRERVVGGDGTFIETLSGPQRGEEVNRHLLPLLRPRTVANSGQTFVTASIGRTVSPILSPSLLFPVARSEVLPTRNFITSNKLSILFIIITIRLSNNNTNFYYLYFYVFQDFSVTNCSYKTKRKRSPKENRNNVCIPFVRQTYRGRCYYHLSPYVSLATFSISLCSRNIVIARYTLWLTPFVPHSITSKEITLYLNQKALLSKPDIISVPPRYSIDLTRIHRTIRKPLYRTNETTWHNHRRFNSNLRTSLTIR